MRKLLTVARFEFLFHVRRKSFLFATFGLPVLLGVAFAALLAVALVTGSAQQRVTAIGYVDYAGVLASYGPEIDLKLKGATSSPLPARRYADEQVGRRELDQGSISVLFVIPADYLETGEVIGFAPEQVPVLARSRFETLLRTALLQRVDNPHPRLSRPITTSVERRLDGRPAPSFVEQVQSLIVPLLFAGLFLWTTFSVSGYLIQSLVDERENRLMEVLASSLRPEVLMGGKIVGLSMLGLVQLAVWLSGAVALLSVAAGRLPLLQATGLSWGRLLLLAALFVLGYLLFAATMSAVGALIAATQQGQQLAGAVMITAVAPLWAVGRLTKEPDSVLSTGLSLFPYTAPVSLPLRLASGMVPLWQVAAALLLLAAAVLGVIVVAGRLMRYTLLRAGKRLGLRELGRALRGG